MVCKIRDWVTEILIFVEAGVVGLFSCTYIRDGTDKCTTIKKKPKTLAHSTKTQIC